MKLCIIYIIIIVVITGVMIVLIMRESQKEYTVMVRNDEELVKKEKRKRCLKRAGIISGWLCLLILITLLLTMAVDYLFLYLAGTLFDSILDSCVGPEHSGNYGGMLFSAYQHLGQ